MSTCVAVSSSVCPSRARSPTGLASFSSETVLDSFSSEVSLVSLERLARSPTGLARDRSLFHRFNFSMFRFHNLNSWCLCSSKECFHKVRKCPFLTCGKKTKKTSQNVNIEPSRAGKKSKKTPKKSLTCGKKELKNIQKNHSAKIAHRAIIAHKVDFSPETKKNPSHVQKKTLKKL